MANFLKDLFVCFSRILLLINLSNSCVIKMVAKYGVICLLVLLEILKGSLRVLFVLLRILLVGWRFSKFCRKVKILNVLFLMFCLILNFVLIKNNDLLVFLYLRERL